MKYFKKYKEANAMTTEITKEEARHTLEGWWTDESLEDIFINERQFRLYTPFCTIWTQDEDGSAPMPGFYGIVG